MSRVEHLALGAALDWDADIGSLVSQAQLETVTAHVKDAVANGATVLAGGKGRPDLGPYFYEPTVLEGVTESAECFAGETFGPLVSLYPYKTTEEAVALANQGEYGLNASLWGKPREAKAIATRIKAGTVNINEGFSATFGSVDAPMGGMRQSGLGRRQGAEGILRYTEPQSIGVQRLMPMTGPELDEVADVGQAAHARPQGPASDAARMSNYDYDVLVIGSGFGGSVSALRLTEKGYKVAVLEAGKRFCDADFAKSSWRLRKFLWMPQLGCYGIQRIDKLKDVLILSGAGVGGGSLVYANTLYEPLDPFYKDAAWGHITDWKAELAPYYDQAKRMLGVDGLPVSCRRPTRSSRRSPSAWVSAARSTTRRSACSSVSPARRSLTRSSVAPDPSATPASTAASA